MAGRFSLTPESARFGRVLASDQFNDSAKYERAEMADAGTQYSVLPGGGGMNCLGAVGAVLPVGTGRAISTGRSTCRSELARECGGRSCEGVVAESFITAKAIAARPLLQVRRFDDLMRRCEGGFCRSGLARECDFGRKNSVGHAAAFASKLAPTERLQPS